MDRRKRIKPGKSLCGLPLPTEFLRFFNKIEVKQVLPLNHRVKGPCWLWTAMKDGEGYGQFKWRGKAIWIHRFSFHVFNHTAIDGFEIDHKCRQRSCCNPEHLRRRTHIQNCGDTIRQPKAEPAPF